MKTDTIDQAGTFEERVQICAHCGAENSPGLLMCMTCGRDPVSGRDLFAPPDIPIPDQPPTSGLGLSSPELSITMPEPIQVPDLLPIPNLEDFIAPPAQPLPVPPPVYRVPPSQPKHMEPLLKPLPRWGIGLLGLTVLALLGLGVAGSLATFNLPGVMCLGSLWLATGILWLGIVLARRGVSYSIATGARRRLVKSLGRRIFEIRPGSARVQRAQLPASRVLPLTQPASQLLYLTSTGDRSSQLAQVLLGTLCVLVAGDHIELASQTYEVLTSSPLRKRLETIKNTVLSRRTLYVGAGYLEKLILQQLRSSTVSGVRDLTSNVLRQAGADLLERIAEEASQASTPQSDEAGEAPNLDAQVTSLREFCHELQALNPELYQQLTQEVQEAVQSWLRATRRGTR